MRKGQIISLDFMVSLIGVVLAIGLLIQGFEMNTYATKEAQAYNELRIVGETAADLLVSNPDIVCNLVDGSGKLLGHLNNCIDTSKTISKEKLGIPETYNYNIEGSGLTLAGNSTLSGNEKNVYAVERTVVTHSGDVPKSCMVDGSCLLAATAITLRVWKV